MLTCEERERRLFAILEEDICNLLDQTNYAISSDLLDAAVATQSEWGYPKTIEERLLNLRNAMLMELTGKVDEDEDIWRVVVEPHKVSALYIGLGAKPPITGFAMSDLPQWMQERVVVLSMLTESPPTKPIKGVGRRITESVYWVVK